jgi:hypothetical protein
MARYDEWTGRGRERGYDERVLRHGAGGAGQGGGGSHRQFGGDRSGYDSGYGIRAQRWGGGAVNPQGGGDWENPGGGTLYGPSRYGLGPYYQRLLNRRRPDGELKEEVEEALFYDSWVDAEAITVDVDDGVVTLRGELPNYEEIRYAIDDAWDVDGVRGVRAELQVRAQTE